MDRPACERCGCKDTAAAGMGSPSPEEAGSGTGRVELYTCLACGATTRSALWPCFPQSGRLGLCRLRMDVVGWDRDTRRKRGAV